MKNKTINNDINFEESLCSFEVSKLLKKREFRVPTNNWSVEGEEDKMGVCYNEEGEKLDNNSHRNPNIFSIPIHSVAIEWIRLNYGIYIMTLETKRRTFYFRLSKANYVDISEYESPQQAIEAGLKYTLENLMQK